MQREKLIPGRLSVCSAIILALLSLAVRSALAEPSSRVEGPRVVKAADLLSPSMLRGDGYRVAERFQLMA